MMTWAILADSSCNLRTWSPQTPGVAFQSVPLTIHVADQEYADDAQLDVEHLNQLVAQESHASSSSCPSVGAWAELFRAYDTIIAITISSQLSGSFEAATTARNIVLEEHVRQHNGQIVGKNIYILDSRAAGGKLEVLVDLLDRYLSNHRDFDDVVRYIQRCETRSQVLFSLCRYENLVKSGRMSRLAGSIASKLSIRVLGTASDEGTIKIVGPTRGERKMYRKIADTMEADGYRGGLVYIDHVFCETAAQEIAAVIENRWPSAEVHIIPCGGLCSYYAEESGIIIGYEWAQQA